MYSIPLLHSFTRSNGVWDEAVLLLFLGGLLGTLGALSFLSARKRRQGTPRRSRKR